MKILLVNDQKSLSLDKTKIKKQISKIFLKEKIKTDEVVFYFVDEKTIKKLHKKFFNDPTLTDCITLPIDPPNCKKPHSILGEAFICTDTAIKYAKKHNIDQNHELTLYIIHCILHLIGYDDIDEIDEKIMRKKEKELINYLIQENIY
ncbi:MAG: rRNA maturation RNase YbeY [Parachlamydiales bacterium]|nr:rRNA maturation RNase YbeY [Parachlamydiales bacterium]